MKNAIGLGLLTGALTSLMLVASLAKAATDLAAWMDWQKQKQPQVLNDE
jgi:Spy/CpxP family protein refolding chaperone